MFFNGKYPDYGLVGRNTV